MVKESTLLHFKSPKADCNIIIKKHSHKYKRLEVVSYPDSSTEKVSDTDIFGSVNVSLEYAYTLQYMFLWGGVSVFELQYVSVNVSLCISLGLA